jgi:hypothetical protein
MLSQSQSQSQSQASTSASALLDRKIEECAAGLWASVTKQLLSISKDNAAAIVKYIDAIKTEVNPSSAYRRNISCYYVDSQNILRINPSKRYLEMIL